MTKRFGKERLFYLIVTLLIALIIFLVSSISSFPVLEKTGIDISSLYHFGVFFMFTFFLTLTLVNKELNAKTIILVLLISLIYSLSDEFHQIFVPGRFSDVKDALTDFAGSSASVVLLKFIEEIKKFWLISRRQILKK
jgi:VanZ family protein